MLYGARPKLFEINIWYTYKHRQDGGRDFWISANISSLFVQTITLIWKYLDDIWFYKGCCNTLIKRNKLISAKFSVRAAVHANDNFNKYETKHQQHIFGTGVN